MYQSKVCITLAVGCLALACGRINYDNQEPPPPQPVCEYPPPGACAPSDLGSAVGVAVATGTTSGTSSEQPSCESGEAPEVAFMWTAPATGVYTFDTLGSSFDTVLHTRLGTCDGPEMACNDDLEGADGDSLLELSVAQGDRVVFFVDGYQEGDQGDFVLSILGTERGLCGDGIDNDGDGSSDCLDSDCSGSLVCAEDGRCNDGTDNDRDALTDCADPECACAEACIPSCSAQPISGLGAPVVTTDHAGACGRRVTPSCMSRSTTLRSLVWTAPSTGRYRIDTSGTPIDSTVSVHLGDCAGPELACDGGEGSSADAEVVLDLITGQEIFVTIGSRDGSAGAIPVNIARTEQGFCRDGADNDGDGQTDCADSDCSGRPACTETGACNDNQDNDGDGDADCADPDCQSDVVCSGMGVVSCPTADLGTAVGQSVGAGVTIGGPQAVDAQCTDASGPEHSFRWTAPSTGMYRFSLEHSDYDTVIHVRHGSCTGPELACSDVGGDTVYLPVQAGDSLIIFADSHADGAGQALLNIEPSEYGSCIDTVDNDGDGLTDCADPECASEQFCGEFARCADGVDNDGDSDTDCDDSDCECDAACLPFQCPGEDLGSAVGRAVTTGDTSIGRSCGQLRASCKESYAPEHTFLWTAPATATYRFDTEGSGFDNVIYLMPPSCDGEQLGCKKQEQDSPAFVELELERGTQLVIAVDGQYGDTGPYILNIIQRELGLCGNGLDDDGDGAADCADDDCTDSLFCCDGNACFCGLEE